MTGRSAGGARECARPCPAGRKFDIVGSVIDPDCVQLSIENARKAGVANTVFFERADAVKRDYSGAGVLFANPPYGERLLDLQQAEKLYADLGRATKNSPMKQYLLSSDPLFERCYGRKADKRRKLYHSMDQVRGCICILKTHLHRISR